MKFSTSDHCAGESTVPRAIQDEIGTAIKTANIKIGKGSGAAIRDAILGRLLTKGWSKEVSVSKDSEMTITSIKDHVGLCLQTGNMSRMYADLLKLQKLYVDNSIRCAVLIVPSHSTAQLIGSNVAQANRLERELKIFKKVIHIPMLVYAID